MAEKIALCIARQFGSGGREVGFALSKALGIAFYDKELLSKAAQKSGITQELFEKNDERPVGGLGLWGGDEGKLQSYGDYMAYLPNDQLQNTIADVIRDVAGQGDCVIIGRCADYILRGRPGTLSVFVHAPLETRIQRIARMHNLDEDKARALIRKTDRNRANYYSYYTDRDWGAVDNFDLAVDAGRLGLDGTVRLLERLVEVAR